MQYTHKQQIHLYIYEIRTKKAQCANRNKKQKKEKKCSRKWDKTKRNKDIIRKIYEQGNNTKVKKKKIRIVI